MAKRRLGIILFLFCLCLHLLPSYANAVSTSDAAEPISLEQDCTVTIQYGYDGVVFPDIPVKLYYIANISADLQYTLTSAFQPSNLILNGIQSVSDWNAIRTTLEAYILANHIETTFSDTTDSQGQVSFTPLTPGLYLAMPDQVQVNDMYYLFDSALITLPCLGADGLWQYEVEVTAKGEAVPPIDPDETVEYKVLKLWKGDSGRTDRPKSVEVDIFRNGTLYQTVVLSEENNWSYSWTAADNAEWLVAERNIPSGYTMTLETKEASFVLTNTRVPDSPDDPPSNPNNPPKTGDTSNILLYTVMMYGSGMLLILLGLVRKRKRT